VCAAGVEVTHFSLSTFSSHAVIKPNYLCQQPRWSWSWSWSCRRSRSWIIL